MNYEGQLKIASRITKRASLILDQIYFEKEVGNVICTIRAMHPNPKEIDGYDESDADSKWKKDQIGGIIVMNEYRDKFSEECLSDVKTLENQLGKKLGIWKPEYVKVMYSLRGLGLGSDLYIQAAKEISGRDGVLVPDRCLISGGQTSPSAERVWESTRVQNELVVIGNNVFWGGKK